MTEYEMQLGQILPFEEPIRKLVEQYGGLKRRLDYAETKQAAVIRAEMCGLVRATKQTWIEEIDPKIDNWQTVLLARHPQRPHTLDYINSIFSGFVELHGDRCSGDDPAIVGGLAKLDRETVMIIGTQKGKDAKENGPEERNFGMSRAEGYRKAQRLMKQAEKFDFPLITLIDTPGASPDAESEKGGIAWAISENISGMQQLRIPTISVIIGEGGSGGALAFAVTDRLLALENSCFTVVSPEGAASILWRDAGFAPRAAEAMKMSSRNLPGILSYARILKEPAGGIHRFPWEMYPVLKCALVEELDRLRQIPLEERLEKRYRQVRRIGAFFDS